MNFLKKSFNITAFGVVSVAGFCILLLLFDMCLFSITNYSIIRNILYPLYKAVSA
jgi:hypothetical protein